MNKLKLAIFCIGAIAVATAVTLPLVREDHTPRTTITWHINDHTFTLETALDEDARERGLMHRTADSLPPDRGMIFAFTKTAPRFFWMNNCLIDLDVIFIDAAGRVVNVSHMTAPPPGTPENTIRNPASPYNASSNYPAQFVIELNRNAADPLHLTPGQKLDLPIDALKRWAR